MAVFLERVEWNAVLLERLYFNGFSPRPESRFNCCGGAEKQLKHDSGVSDIVQKRK
jgi:hypothetical protein